MSRITDREIARLRLRNQHLTGAPLATPEEVVGWLGAVQSQELPFAKWGVARRMRGAKEPALDRALAAGTILRTHVLRPTWHFALPTDLRWMLELSAPRVRTAMASYDRKLGLDAALVARSNALLERAVAGGRHLTRKELAAELERGGIAAHGQRLGHLMARAELDRVLVSGASRGKLQTYALFDERAAGARSLPRDEALAELGRRYFRSHGPATPRDFAWWSGSTVAEARRGVEMVAGELERICVGERTYWLAGPAAGRRQASPVAHLLQGYDEYIIAYGESRDVLDLEGGARLPPGAVPFLHAVALDGQVVGRWRRLASTPERIEVRLARPLDPRQMDALEAEVERYGRYLGLPAQLGLTTASAFVSTSKRTPSGPTGSRRSPSP